MKRSDYYIGIAILAICILLAGRLAGGELNIVDAFTSLIGIE